jgi:hypothetical protein
MDFLQIPRSPRCRDVRSPRKAGNPKACSITPPKRSYSIGPGRDASQQHRCFRVQLPPDAVGSEQRTTLFLTALGMRTNRISKRQKYLGSSFAPKVLTEKARKLYGLFAI